jgi:predicted RNase H-like HicB family nuclease
MTKTSWPTSTSIDHESRVSRNREGIWVEQISQDDDLRMVVFQRPMPLQLIRDYARLAVRHADIQEQEDGTFLAKIHDFPGVWANEATLTETLDVLEDVVYEWALLKISDQDRDLPVVGSLDLNTL